MRNNLLPFIRECLQSNELLYKIILSYSFILVLIGGQLPALFYFITMILATLGLGYWFVTYSKWNNSQEFLETLPDYNKSVKKARIIAAILITFSFYMITLFSYLRQVMTEQSKVEPMLFFTIKCLVVLFIYLVIYRIFHGRGIKRPSNTMFRNLRLLMLLICILIVVFIFYSYRLNDGFFTPVELIDNPTKMVPNSFDKDYIAKNPDKLLINAYVSEYGDIEKVSYTSHKIIDYPKSNDFSMVLSELPQSPARFDNIIISLAEDSFITSNLNKVDAEHSSWTSESKFNRSGITLLHISTPWNELSIKDPWYRRMFHISESSIQRDTFVRVEIIAYNSSEGLKSAPISSRYSREWYDANFYYLRHTKEKLEKIENKYNRSTLRNYRKYDAHNEKYIVYNNYTKDWRSFSQPGRNYCNQFKLLYTLFTILLTCGFIGFNFVNYRMFIHLLFVLGVFIFIDKSLNEDRFKTINDDNSEIAFKCMAAADLNNSIYFRESAADKLKVIYEELSNSQNKITLPHYRNSWLMLVNKRNLCLDINISDTQFFYDKKKRGNPDLHLGILENTPLFNLGKILVGDGYYHRSWDYKSELFLITNSNYFNVGAAEKARNGKSREFDKRLQLLKGLSIAEKLTALQSDIVLSAYILRSKCRISVEKIMGKGYVPKIDEVIEIGEEKQLELVLDYLNKGK